MNEEQYEKSNDTEKHKTTDYERKTSVIQKLQRIIAENKSENAASIICSLLSNDGAFQIAICEHSIDVIEYVLEILFSKIEPIELTQLPCKIGLDYQVVECNSQQAGSHSAQHYFAIGRSLVDHVCEHEEPRSLLTILKFYLSGNEFLSNSGEQNPQDDNEKNAVDNGSDDDDADEDEEVKQRNRRIRSQTTFCFVLRPIFVLLNRLQTYKLPHSLQRSPHDLVVEFVREITSVMQAFLSSMKLKTGNDCKNDDDDDDDGGGCDNDDSNIESAHSQKSCLAMSARFLSICYTHLLVDSQEARANLLELLHATVIGIIDRPLFDTNLFLECSISSSTSTSSSLSAAASISYHQITQQFFSLWHGIVNDAARLSRKFGCKFNLPTLQISMRNFSWYPLHSSLSSSFSSASQLALGFLLFEPICASILAAEHGNPAIPKVYSVSHQFAICLPIIMHALADQSNHSRLHVLKTAVSMLSGFLENPLINTNQIISECTALQMIDDCDKQKHTNTPTRDQQPNEQSQQLKTNQKSEEKSKSSAEAPQLLAQLLMTAVYTAEFEEIRCRAMRLFFRLYKMYSAPYHRLQILLGLFSAPFVSNHCALRTELILLAKNEVLAERGNSTITFFTKPNQIGRIVDCLLLFMPASLQRIANAQKINSQSAAACGGGSGGGDSTNSMEYCRIVTDECDWIICVANTIFVFNNAGIFNFSDNDQSASSSSSSLSSASSSRVAVVTRDFLEMLKRIIYAARDCRQIQINTDKRDNATTTTEMFRGAGGCGSNEETRRCTLEVWNNQLQLAMQAVEQAQTAITA